MDNFGISISQDGVSVTDAADSQKVLDSGWEYMNIHKEETVDVYHEFTAASVICVPLVSHDLAFLPAYSVQIESHTNATETDFFIGFVANDKSTYATVQYSRASTTSLTISMRITVRIFDVDITRSYKAPIKTANPSAEARDSNFGAFALSDTGSSMLSHDISDYSLNTGAKAICIQEHGIAVPANGVLTIEHDFGAPPAFAIARYYPDGIDFGIYGKPLGNDPLVATINSTEGLGTANRKNLILRGAQATLSDSLRYAYLLFKDPLETSL